MSHPKGHIPHNFVNHTGRRFGRLIVLSIHERTKQGPRWLCQCDCGVKKSVLAGNLTSGRQVSCGCRGKEARLKYIASKRVTKEHKLARAREYSKKWAARNSARIYQAKKSTPERWTRVLDDAKKWRAANREKVRSFCRNARARREAAPGTHTAADIDAILRRQQYECAVCRHDVSAKRHVDHIVALSCGGSNDPSNLQILCPSCNMSKGNKGFFSWLSSRKINAGALNEGVPSTAYSRGVDNPGPRKNP